MQDAAPSLSPVLAPVALALITNHFAEWRVGGAGAECQSVGGERARGAGWELRVRWFRVSRWWG